MIWLDNMLLVTVGVLALLLAYAIGYTWGYTDARMKFRKTIKMQADTIKNQRQIIAAHSISTGKSKVSKPKRERRWWR